MRTAIFCAILSLLLILSACSDNALRPISAIPQLENEHSAERDAAWVADVQFLLKHLKGHPLFEATFFTSQRSTEQKAWAKAFQAQVKADITAACEALVAQVPELTDLEIHRELLRMVALFSAHAEHGDGHTYLLFPGLRQDMFPFGIQSIGDGYYLTGYYSRGSYPEKAELKSLLGSRLVSVNGMEMAEVETLFARHFNADNAVCTQTHVPIYLPSRTFMVLLGLCENDDSPVTLVLEDANGGQHTLALGHVLQVERFPPSSMTRHYTYAHDTGNQPLFLQPANNAFFVKKLKGAHYIRIAVFADFMPGTKQYEQYMAQYQKILDACQKSGYTDKIIVDVRGNPGGVSGLMDAMLHATEPHQALIDGGRFYAIIDRGSYSQAALMAYAMAERLGATLVGEPASGGKDCYSRGEAAALPSGRGELSIAYAAFSNGTARGYQGDFDTSPLKPHVYIDYTLEDYLAGADPALDWILAQE